MKIVRIVVLMLAGIGFLWSATSCLVLTPIDSANHTGWNKNPNNPHHPYSSNPGKSQGHHKK